MAPTWITHTAGLSHDGPALPSNSYPVILCTASQHLSSDAARETNYVQGAADDHESWGHGLTPLLYWQHQDQLRAASEDELPDLIAGLIRDSAEASTSQEMRLIKPTDNLYVGVRDCAIDLPNPELCLSIILSDLGRVAENDQSAEDKKTLRLNCVNGKIGSRMLRHELAQVPAFLESHAAHRDGRGQQPGASDMPVVHVTCASGKDHSIGVALAILCLYYSDIECRLVVPRDLGARRLDKNVIKQRLSMIMQSVPDANPSRTTLQSINAFLLGGNAS